MDITYLQKLKDTPEINTSSFKIKGISEEEISKYEKQLKIKFPKAYKEFLYLAGGHHGYLMMLRGHSGIEELANPEVQKYLNNKKQRAGVNIKRPYWIFTEEDDVFYFFYLDENTDDPKVYVCDWGFREAEIEPYYKYTFSQYLYSLIKNSKDYYDKSY